jgi:hypothetical protein
MYNFTANHLPLLLSNELTPTASEALLNACAKNTDMHNAYLELQTAWQNLADFEIEPSAGCLSRLQNALMEQAEMV